MRQSPPPPVLEGIVDGDVEEGMRPYAFVRTSDRTYAIRHESGGRVFSVETCRDESACKLELPALDVR